MGTISTIASLKIEEFCFRCVEKHRNFGC